MNTNQSDWFREMQSLVESNARSIQALADAQVEARLEREELRESAIRVDAAIIRLEDTVERLTTLNEGIANLLATLDSDRPTILSRLSRIENKVDQLLSRGDDSNA